MGGHVVRRSEQAKHFRDSFFGLSVVLVVVVVVVVPVVVVPAFSTKKSDLRGDIPVVVVGLLTGWQVTEQNKEEN